MPATLEQGEAESVIRLVGAVDIACAAELKTLLIEALDAGKAVRVALDDEADLDVTAIELLWAAAREAKGSGIEFGLAGPASERVCGALMDAGFQSFPVPAIAR